MKKGKVRIGLIGCGGYMRYAHVPLILKEKSAEIAAVSDPQQSQIDLLLQRHALAAPAYSDYREMIRREKLDAVFICTPHSQHYEQARFALERNLHVLVQKPFTIRSDHALKLVTLAEKKSRFLMVAYQRFYQEQSNFARELIAKKRIGEVRGISCYITQKWDGVLGWRTDPALAGGGFMMDTGSHLVSVVLRITGLKPVAVRAVTENRGKRVDISSVVTVHLENGALCSLSFFGDVLRHEESISFHGTEGSLELSASQWKPETLRLNNEPVEVPPRFKPNSPDAAFIKWIRTGGKGYEPPHTAVDTIKLTEAIYHAAREGKMVPVRL